MGNTKFWVAAALVVCTLLGFKVGEEWGKYTTRLQFVTHQVHINWRSSCI